MENLEFWHHHGGVSVANLDEALEFYCSKLNFKVENRFEIPHTGVEVAMVVNGPLRMEIFCAPNANPLPEGRNEPNQDIQTIGNKHISFAVKNVDEFAAVLKERGVDIVWVKRFPFGANIFIRDNCGNLIEFVESNELPNGIATI